MDVTIKCPNCNAFNCVDFSHEPTAKFCENDNTDSNGGCGELFAYYMIQHNAGHSTLMSFKVKEGETSEWNH